MGDRHSIKDFLYRWLFDISPLRSMLAVEFFYLVSPSAEPVVSVNNEIGASQKEILRRPYLTLRHDLTIMRAAFQADKGWTPR